MHLFVFTPGKSQQLVREYLCKCEPCINLDFENCIHHNNSGETSQDNDIDFDIDCSIEVDEDVETVAKKDHLYDFIDVPSFVTVFSSHSAHELFYLFKITKKLVAENNKEDIYGHKIFKGERYFEGYYLEKVNEKRQQIVYKLVDKYVVYIHIAEISNMYVDFDTSTMTMNKEEYISLLSSF